ncbi:MAG: dTDP-4-dehydrorhamnose 3,5-epimerase family protein [Paracoccaceae bacterium]|jgi:dTDP-4-dehydrorhamnose 3,5-epimerase
MSFEIEVTKSAHISGAKIISFSSHRDERGSLFSLFDKALTELILPTGLEFGHVKFAINNKKTLRGIHGDEKSWKLVTCVHGEIFQVAVDNRKENSNFLQTEELFLSGSRPQALLLPPGVGNGFYSLTESVYCYSLSYEGAYSDDGQQFTIKWNDPRLNIKWPDKFPVLSERDA